ncbi:hypothetical protein UCDDS831_g03386 [Diplodia seriata]|uniref:Uncharacterized protein n=1 Tax=Diplodia seriata TaxID=420778 RepID=A0A0G2ELD4_9PEZI|nr:hypothetical protein UCDDS831_g03386 [Diplodia seriata]
MAAPVTKTFVVEHLDPELEAWSSLEYAAIARESRAVQCRFLLSSVPETLKLPEKLVHIDGLEVEHDSIENLFEKAKVCLLDPAAKQELSPADGDHFDVFLFGGILGDDPPRDRTSELRKKGFEGLPLESIPFVDNPEIRVDAHESTEMPFRYVTNKDGQPIMPEGMMELIKKDSERGFGDLL